MLYHLKHPELGIEVRATVLDIPHPNTPYFVGVDLANWLYYSDASHAVKSRVAKNNSFTYKFNEPKCKSRLKLINLQGAKQLIEAANYGRTNPIILPNTQQKLFTWFIDVNETLANPNEMVSLPDVTTTTSATDVTTVFTVEEKPIYNKEETHFISSTSTGGTFEPLAPTVFPHEEFGNIRTTIIDGKPYFMASDIAKALGYAKPNSAIQQHCRATLKHSTPISGKMQEVNFIGEGDMYRLITHSKLESAERFERWIFDEVLPTIRNTGGYVHNEDLFINTYLPFVDDNTKQLFKLTLHTMNALNKQIKEKNKTIEHQDLVIRSFVENTPKASKRSLINEIIRFRGNGESYGERYRSLYKEFNYIYHMNVEVLYNNHKAANKLPFVISVLDYIDKVLGMIDQLFEVAVSLFETDVLALNQKKSYKI